MRMVHLTRVWHVSSRTLLEHRDGISTDGGPSHVVECRSHAFIFDTTTEHTRSGRERAFEAEMERAVQTNATDDAEDEMLTDDELARRAS